MRRSLSGHRNATTPPAPAPRPPPLPPPEAVGGPGVVVGRRMALRNDTDSRHNPFRWHYITYPTTNTTVTATFTILQAPAAPPAGSAQPAPPAPAPAPVLYRHNHRHGHNHQHHRSTDTVNTTSKRTSASIPPAHPPAQPAPLTRFESFASTRGIEVEIDHMGAAGGFTVESHGFF